MAWGHMLRTLVDGGASDHVDDIVERDATLGVRDRLRRALLWLASATGGYFPRFKTPEAARAYWNARAMANTRSSRSGCLAAR